jgi:hypothetical protein
VPGEAEPYRPSQRLGKVAVDGKSNEITAFAPLLEPLDLTGAVITVDAMHTQCEHAARHDRNGHHATMPGPWVDGLMRVLAFEGGTGCDSDPQATSPSKIIPKNAVVHPHAVRGLGWPT